MIYLIILAAIAILPVVAILLFRVNGAVAFMSLALGSVLVRYTSADVASIVSGLSSHPGTNLLQWVSIGLLGIPFLLSLLFTRRSVSGNKQFTNVLPALASGMLFALLLVPLFSVSLQAPLESQRLWQILSNLQTAVLLGGAFFSLLFLLLSHRGHTGGDDKKHGKH